MAGNPVQCKSCIFKSPVEGGTELPPERMSEIYAYLLEGKQHTCHSDSRYACRGGRDIQLRLLCGKGAIESPTDEALQRANNEYLANHQQNN
jgi:hypothetical protein